MITTVTHSPIVLHKLKTRKSSQAKKQFTADRLSIAVLLSGLFCAAAGTAATATAATASAGRDAGRMIAVCVLIAVDP